MQPRRVKVDTLLQGYRLDTNRGAVAFCSVKLLEVPDETGVVRRPVVDTGHTGRRGPLKEQLAKRGLSCSDIDIVICTHAHWDHIENLDIFDRAEILLHKDERRYIARPHKNDTGCPGWIDAVFEHYRGRLRGVEEGDRPLPGIEIVDAPGHSAGTIAVTANTDEGIAVITGDSVQNSTVACACRKPDRHAQAASSYSWMRPPSRSCRRRWQGYTTVAGTGPAFC